MEIKWYKAGEECIEGKKYQLKMAEENVVHSLTVNDVQTQDEGIYTVKVIDSKVESNVRVQGQWPGEIPKDVAALQQ